MPVPRTPLLPALATALIAAPSCGPLSGECNTENEGCAPGAGCDVEESSTMLPGADCLACHSPGNLEEAEDDDDGDDDDDDNLFTAAGTVFTDGLGWDGAEDIVVRITDAEGRVIELATNSVGNFRTSAQLVFPILAEVERDGVVEAMNREVDYGGCNDCHRCEGEAEAKLYAP